MSGFKVGDTVVRTRGLDLKDWKMVLGRRLTVVDWGDNWLQFLEVAGQWSNKNFTKARSIYADSGCIQQR